MDEREFMAQVRRARGKRVHKVRNSFGVKDAFIFYRKVRPRESEYVLSESEFLRIVRRTNDILRQLMIQGQEIVLPEHMGKLELRKRQTITDFKDGKLRTNLPVDWDSTLKLWYEDEESYHKKRLVRQESREVYKVYYNKYKADYPNKSFYQFRVNREIKKGLKQRIKNNELDALLIYRVNHGEDNNNKEFSSKDKETSTSAGHTI